MDFIIWTGQIPWPYNFFIQNSKKIVSYTYKYFENGRIIEDSKRCEYKNEVDHAGPNSYVPVPFVGWATAALHNVPFFVYLNIFIFLGIALSLSCHPLKIIRYGYYILISTDIKYFEKNVPSQLTIERYILPKRVSRIAITD